MSVEVVERDDTSLLDHCTKYLARERLEPAADGRLAVPDGWRFPVVDSHYDGEDYERSYAFNEVTFYFVHLGEEREEVAVLGSFGTLWEPVPLRPVTFLGEPTRYSAVTVVVPKGEVHTYKLLVDGRAVLDPINPQRTRLDNGREWSRFFTQLCAQPLSFERWELALLERLTDHILPFQTGEAELFMARGFEGFERQDRFVPWARSYRLQESVGAVNYIDKLLAREEAHNLDDYRTCLRLVDRALRRRNPAEEPARMSAATYAALYADMAADRVDGWDYGAYGSPSYFLKLLRRHTFTGAFSHPKYGGNVGGVAWAYLEERYRDEEGRTLFDWRRVMERPLGRSASYHG